MRTYACLSILLGTSYIPDSSLLVLGGVRHHVFRRDTFGCRNCVYSKKQATKSIKLHGVERWKGTTDS